MSTIYFHSPSGEARVSGAERAHAQLLCTEYFLMALGVDSFSEAKEYRKLLPTGAYPLSSREDKAFFESFRIYCNGFLGDSYLIMPATGKPINLFHAALNSMVAGGSDAIRLLAKLHAQSEIHCYVEGKNRAWLADVIAQGVKDKILRTWGKYDDARTGWQSVIGLLRTRDDEPVVTSYSVTEQFPNYYTAKEYEGWKPAMTPALIRGKYELSEDEDTTEWEADYISEVWDELPDAEKWRLAMTGLREANKRGHLEIDPETLATQGYGDGLSGFDIYAAMYDLKESNAQTSS